MFQDCPNCPKMVSLPPGRFTMGQGGGDPSERPAHKVKIGRRFALGIYEVTYGEWKACVGAGECDPLPKLKGAQDASPVRNVSWTDAQKYVAWLRDITRKPYRLPTEAEWEYAARANTATIYWWGNRIGVGRANCKNCGGDWNRKIPAKAGSFPANPFGLHDMNGSVWEWVNDCWNTTYNGAPRDGSSWDKRNCQRHVLRGGSWRNSGDYAMSSSRFYYDSSVRYTANGFRVALTLN
jgi:formylglycine-generating enzyme required for sulfatase activity